MPAAIPDRYRLEVRLGRDGDIEEWLATDTSLDRPVLVRSLGPDSSPDRRADFAAKVGAAAKTSHQHLARVFTVGVVAGGVYAISEWTGGATLADRVAADQPVELPEFLPNAAGLAGALAALHDAGAVHGGIDTSAISYSGAHAAKLGAFGRAARSDESADVRALAGALETALTGSPPGGPPPSERVDGVPRAIDKILRSGQSGVMSAVELENALRAAPTPRAPQPESGTTQRRVILAAVALVVVAVALVTVGFVLSGGTNLVVPTPTTAGLSPTTTTPSTTSTTRAGSVAVTDAETFDPFGQGGENDELVANLVDGDFTTEWRTERYLDPLPLLKEGVGVTVRVTGSPRRLRLIALSASTAFELYWSRQRLDDLSVWERIAGAVASPATTSIDLPARQDGFWLVWLTDLPVQDDGTYRASIAELRFTP